MSSKRITNVRPRRSSLSVFVEILGRGAGVAAGAAGTWIASKLTIDWGAPSSKICKLSLVMPVMGFPFLSVTTTSTVTCSTWAGKVAGGSSFVGA